MNITIAATELEHGFTLAHGGIGGAIFAGTLVLAGIALLVVGSRILRRCHEQHAVRYSVPVDEAA